MNDYETKSMMVGSVADRQSPLLNIAESISGLSARLGHVGESLCGSVNTLVGASPEATRGDRQQEPPIEAGLFGLVAAEVRSLEARLVAVEEQARRLANIA